MGDFANSFPDDVVISVLGDEITLLKSGGGTSTFNGVFEYKYVEEEDVDRLNIIVPTVECNNAEGALVGRLDRLQYNGKTFRVLKKRPIDVGMTQIILKD